MLVGHIHGGGWEGGGTVHVLHDEQVYGMEGWRSKKQRNLCLFTACKYSNIKVLQPLRCVTACGV